MKKVIIPQKMSNTGSIHDIASQHGDRVIRFPKGTLYAIVLASFHGDHYTTHKTKAAAIQANKRQSEFSRQIVGVDGHVYQNYDGRLFHSVDAVPYEVQDFEAVTEAAATLGSSTSEAKKKAARENGAKSKGRPKKYNSSEELNCVKLID